MFCRHVFGNISCGFRGISRFLGNFAGFRGNAWISRVRDRAKYQKPWLWWRGRKEKELATTSLEYEFLLRKSRCEMLIGIMTSLPLARVFQCLFTFVLVSTSRWLAEIWHSSWRNATGELEVEFKFQRRSCKLSVLFLPYHQSALESLFAGYWMCSYYMYTYSLHTVSGTSL